MKITGRDLRAGALFLLLWVLANMIAFPFVGAVTASGSGTRVPGAAFGVITGLVLTGVQRTFVRRGEKPGNDDHRSRR